MEDKKELSEVQRFAMQAAKQRADEAQIFLRKITINVCQELSIPESDLLNWQFKQGFKYIERIKSEENNGRNTANGKEKIQG